MSIKAQHSWSFTSEVGNIDIPRIIDEAEAAAAADGTGVRCIRITVKGKPYTLTNLDWLSSSGFDFKFDPNDGYALKRWASPLAFLRDDGEPRLWSGYSLTNSYDEDRAHPSFDTSELHRGARSGSLYAQSPTDNVKHLLDGVETRVEVF